MVMNISSISSNTYFVGNENRSQKRFNTVKWSGYAAVAAGVGSAIAGNRKSIKTHKYLAYLAGLFTLWHIGIVEYNSYKYRKEQK